MFGNKVYCFCHFWISIKNCSEFLRKSTVRWSKLHSTSTDDLAEKEEQISWKTHNFLHFFENSSVKFTEIGENFMHSCKNCILHVRSSNSRNFWCLGIKFSVFITFEFYSNYVGFLRKKTARWSKLHSTSTNDPAKKEEQISWITNNFFLRIWATNLRSLVWKLHARLSKLHATCTKEQF